jgi:hypothetical protein
MALGCIDACKSFVVKQRLKTAYTLLSPKNKHPQGDEGVAVKHI